MLASNNRAVLIGGTKYPYLNMGTPVVEKGSFDMSFVERDLYFILNNSNGKLYDRVDGFGPKFIESKTQSIDSRLAYLSGISLTVSVVILLSGLAIIPLFGKIQNRILELMKLFFQIDPEVKRQIVTKIERFVKVNFKKEVLK